MNLNLKPVNVFPNFLFMARKVHNQINKNQWRGLRGTEGSEMNLNPVLFGMFCGSAFAVCLFLLFFFPFSYWEFKC